MNPRVLFMAGLIMLSAVTVLYVALASANDFKRWQGTPVHTHTYCVHGHCCKMTMHSDDRPDVSVTAHSISCTVVHDPSHSLAVDLFSARAVQYWYDPSGMSILDFDEEFTPR